jgi:hypothetical protein
VATAATGPKAATPSQNPTVDTAGRDPVTRSPMYEATWTGALGVSAWDPWLVRAVARPVDSLPVDGVRGQISDASDVVSVIVPPAGPPDLDVLTADIWDADHRGVVVRTSTSAPARATASGSHRIGSTSGPGAGDVLVPVAFEGLAETPLTTAPGAASTGPVLERGVRSSGRSPVALWFKRPVATDPVDVAVRLIDPFGRATERRITVPGWVAPPPFTITISGSASRPTGVLVSMTTDASSAAAAGIVLHVRALKRRFGPIFGPLGGVGGAGAGGPFIRPPIDRLRPLVIVASADFPLSGISTGLPFFPADGQVHVVRVRGLGGGRRYAVWIPVVAPLVVELGLESPDGQTATVNASV